ncbi:MAG TPA: thiamine pyrophosphate-binding protein [Terriglobia bacterium]|nr:thiamine pyrophosphate-binding protein [Terriglobia bacterium]
MCSNIAMTGGQLIVECLARHGVEVIFGMPGAHTMAIYDALYRHPKIKHILVRHEESAALMADGYSRATGKLGVCCVTTGPGVTNAATGLAVAHGDSIPVLLISSQVHSEAAKTKRGLFHAMDQLALTRPITKWNARADTPEQIPQVIAEAFRVLTNGRRGAGHVEVPLNVLQQELEVGSSMFEVNSSESSSEGRISNSELQRAAQLLSGAQRPLILAGGGVIAAGAWAALVEIAELLQAPVLMSPMGKGVIPADHPLCGGVTFTWVTADLQNMEKSMSPLAGMADAVLAVGFRFSQLATVNYSLPVPRHLVQIDIDPAEVGANYPVDVGIVADAKEALPKLREALEGGPRGARLGWMPDSARPQPRIDVGPAGHLPVDWWELREELDRDAIVAADIARSGYALVGQFPVYQPRSFMHSASFIAMGHALPAALGAKVAFPDRQVVSVSGDGCFLMTGQELATAVQHGINVVAIVINDRCLTGIAALQNAHYRGRNIAVELVNPDFVRFAESFGALGLRVTRAEEFRPALQKALRAEKPALIEIVC